LHAEFLFGIAVGARFSSRQDAADSIFIAYQLLRYRIHTGCGPETHGDGFMPGQPAERRGRAGGTKHECDVRMERGGGAEMRIVVKLGGATLEDSALLQ